ncbi:signal recognition particle, SRP19 subunit [Pseudovirgaria hyperparasitica]|uniref:Signal recognition particle, SRP19 subunit n=1 Tax=Pseudovirgaria hyperparasitica TaxID=470096 RepID=A0A6A6W796_9PEZI|nr:signal recognition particle, SRP19 subunit [Pseudovirgaria hyperparasitica]KAF2756951.1 signal recognition particle, SRP19 subunit [Pseudovirgaria hyperparasitica]
MSHARVEEVSDSDPDEMDIADFDPRGAILQPASLPNPSSSSLSSGPSFAQPPMQAQAQFRPDAAREAEQAARSKNWQCIYPVYFDASRTRAEGRRVGKNRAVQNPLARELIDALQVQAPGLEIVFEPGKIHPKDWANPGRVRVCVKQEGKSVVRGVQNKHHLYNLISDYLLLHPTEPETPLRLRIQGLPAPKGAPPPPAVPRGWKMNTILPLHSPAVTGGGISENFLKDMMAEMQGEAPGSGNASGSEAPAGKKKKDKKKK